MSKRAKHLSLLFLLGLLLFFTACANGTGVQSTASLYYTPYPTLTPIITSVTTALPTSSVTVPAPTDTPTLASEPDIVSGCMIVNDDGEIYLLSDEIFFAFGPREEEIDQVLADDYPEWASYKQNVEWDTKPVRLGEIISSASFDDRFNLNPAVILVVLGENLNWQIPPDSDLFLKSESISERLADLAIEWMKPENEHIRNRYPDISNAATYALYAFFDYDIEKLQIWCHTYHKLFEVLP